jgi:hypothetical protein
MVLSSPTKHGGKTAFLRHQSTGFEPFSFKPLIVLQRLMQERAHLRSFGRRRTAVSVKQKSGTTAMIAILRNRVARGTLYALVAASTGLAATAATAASPRYDGIWSVSIVTEKGDCDRGYRYPIRISHGVLANGGSDPFTISGRVLPSGAITVMVSAGQKSATGTGRLAGNSGQGFWTGNSCSGSWSAERRDADQAEAASD